MPSQRQKGTKLAGAYVTDEKDAALAAIAKKKGFENKADYIRALFDAALKEEAAPKPTSAKPAPKAGSRARGR